MKLYRTLVSAFVAAILSLVGGRDSHAALEVVASTADLAAIARAVGGPATHVVVLATATQDPHFVDARPNLALALNRADLLIVQGLDLEVGWLPTLQNGARNPKIIVGAEGYLDGSGFIGALEVPQGAVSRAQGDIHRGGNPHYLYDPRNAAKIARGIATRLASLDPPNAAAYDERSTAFERSATELAAVYVGKFGTLDAQRRKIVVYHRSWIYLEKWLGLEEVGAVEPKPGIPPDPAHVARLMGSMRADAVRAVVSEDYYPQTMSKLLAEKAGASLVVLPGATPDGQEYVAHMQAVAEQLYAALAK